MLWNTIYDYGCAFNHKSTESNQSRQPEIKDKPQISYVCLFVITVEYFAYVIRIPIIRIIEISVTYQPSSCIIGKDHHILKDFIRMNFPSSFFGKAEKSFKSESNI